MADEFDPAPLGFIELVPISMGYPWPREFVHFSRVIRLWRVGEHTHNPGLRANTVYAEIEGEPVHKMREVIV